MPSETTRSRWPWSTNSRLQFGNFLGLADVFLPQRLGAVQVGRPPQRHALFHAARVCKTGCNVIYKSCVVKTATAKRSLAWRGCPRQCFVWPLGCLCALTLASASRVPPLRPMPTPLQRWCWPSTGRASPSPCLPTSARRRFPSLCVPSFNLSAGRTCPRSSRTRPRWCPHLSCSRWWLPHVCVCAEAVAPGQ